MSCSPGKIPGERNGVSSFFPGLMTWPDPTGTNSTFTIDVTGSKGGVGAQPVTLPVVPPPGAGVITFTSTPRESFLLGLEYVH